MDFVSKVPIEKGWSDDQKYCVTDKNATKYLLRISDMKEYETKRAEFEMMTRVAALGVPMCQPIEFGLCEEGAYSLQSWIDGADAEETIGQYSEAEQYAYGLQAGRILRKIHSIPAPATQEDWEQRYNRKIDGRIANYQSCPLKYRDGQPFIAFAEKNRDLLKGRPQVYQHGDYHVGNMMIGEEGKLYIIDFNRNDYGDPWEDNKAITWDIKQSPAFASGRIDGYFEGEVPPDFWRGLALYICCGVLASLPWAIPYGEGEIATMQKQADNVLSWYDGMQTFVPTWYKGKRGPVITLCGSVKFRDDFIREQARLTAEGYTVLSVGGFDLPEKINEHEIALLKARHKSKIELSDAIFVINHGGYIGKSTREEIAFAEKVGKQVKFMEPPLPQQ